MQKIYFFVALFSFYGYLSAQVSSIEKNSSDNFENGWWEWISGSEISDDKLNKIAPNLPHPKQAGFSSETYDKLIYKWQTLYPFEYQDLINTPELTALNPYYDGYQKIIEMPYFIRPLTSYERPLRKNYGQSTEDEISFELDTQAWYFVFHPSKFKEKFYSNYTFPEWFDEDAFRNQIINKIENSKKEAERLSKE